MINFMSLTMSSKFFFLVLTYTSYSLGEVYITDYPIFIFLFLLYGRMVIKNLKHYT